MGDSGTAVFPIVTYQAHYDIAQAEMSSKRLLSLYTATNARIHMD